MCACVVRRSMTVRGRSRPQTADSYTVNTQTSLAQKVEAQTFDFFPVINPLFPKFDFYVLVVVFVVCVCFF